MKKQLIIIAILYFAISVSAWWIFDNEETAIPRIDIGKDEYLFNLTGFVCSDILACVIWSNDSFYHDYINGFDWIYHVNATDRSKWDSYVNVTYYSDEIYINQISNNFTLNETLLNQTMDNRDSDTTYTNSSFTHNELTGFDWIYHVNATDRTRWNAVNASENVSFDYVTANGFYQSGNAMWDYSDVIPISNTTAKWGYAGDIPLATNVSGTLPDANLEPQIDRTGFSASSHMQTPIVNSSGDVEIYGQGQMTYGLEIGTDGNNPSMTATAGTINILSTETDLLKLRRLSEGAGASSRLYLGVDTTYAKSSIGHVRNAEVTNGVGELYFAIDSNDDANDVELVADVKMIIDKDGKIFMEYLASGQGDADICYVESTGELVWATGGSCSSSSMKHKEDIRELTYGLDDVIKLKPVFFKLKTENDTRIGLIAEDVEKVIPELVVYNEKGDLETIRFYDLHGVTIKAIQELKLENDLLQLQIIDLQNESLVMHNMLDYFYDEINLRITNVYDELNERLAVIENKIT